MPDRELTLPHQHILSLLEQLGYSAIAEVEFPPNRVDCYLPDYHLAIEVDGPDHNPISDQRRDESSNGSVCSTCT